MKILPKTFFNLFFRKFFLVPVLIFCLLLSFSAYGDNDSNTITYINMDGATNHASNPDTYAGDSPAITLKSASKDKVCFVCWRQDSATGAPVSSIPSGSTGGKTFYAEWTTTEEYSIIAQVNSVRLKPKEYAAMLQKELASIANRETRNHYNAAINALNAAKPCSALYFDKVLYLAARDHAQDLIKTNTFSHTGSKGSSPSDRVAAQAKSFGASITYIGENIAAGTTQDTGAKLVKQWVLSQGHRENIMRCDYTISGAALMSGHKSYNWIGVLVFARNK